MRPIHCDIEIQDGSVKKKAALLRWDETPENPDEVRLQLTLSHQSWESRSERGYFHALCDLRMLLEQAGILIICNGCSENVFPSPLIESMGTGEKAYKLTLTKPARTSDLISIFECEEGVVPSTLLNQRQFYDRWLESIR